MSKMASFRQFDTLLWGFAASLAALLGGCAHTPMAAHQAQLARTEATTSAPSPSATAAPTDNATKLSDWVEAHQSDHDAENKWPEFVDVATQVAGAWDYFKQSDDHMREFIAADPDNHWPAAEPGTIVDDPAYAQFIPDLRVFFKNIERSQLMFRLDGLVAESRFIASRPQGSLMAALQPEMGHGRTIGKLWCARMHLAAVDRDMPSFHRSLRHLIAVVRAVQGRGTNISALVAYAIISSTESRVRREILEGRLSPEACAATALALRELTFPDPRVIAGGERFFTLEAIEQVFDAAGNEAAPSHPAARTAIKQGLGVLAPRDEQLALANRLHDGWIAAFSDDPAERERGQRDIDAVLATVDAKNGGMYAPLSIVIPSLGGLRSGDLAARTRHDGTLIMLALQTFRARVGRYPERLDDLVPADLDRVPTDRYAPPAALRYRLLDAQSADPAKAYILYSVGLDGVDDGGKKHPTNNYNAVNRAGKGFDFILNCVD